MLNALINIPIARQLIIGLASGLFVMAMWGVGHIQGSRAAEKRAEAEKAEIIATYQASALAAEQLYAEKLKAAAEEKQKWMDFAQAQSRELAAAYRQIDRQAAETEKQIDASIQKDGSRFNGLGADSVRLYNRALGYAAD